jgi:hypothetical protein
VFVGPNPRPSPRPQGKGKGKGKDVECSSSSLQALSIRGRAGSRGRASRGFAAGLGRSLPGGKRKATLSMISNIFAPLTLIDDPEASAPATTQLLMKWTRSARE